MLGAATVSAYTRYKLVPVLRSGTNSVVQTASESPVGPSYSPAPPGTKGLPSLPLPSLPASLSPVDFLNQSRAPKSLSESAQFKFLQGPWSGLEFENRLGMELGLPGKKNGMPS